MGEAARLKQVPADGHLTGVAVTLTADQLSDICPRAPGAALAPLNTILGRTRSITDRRAAMLIAQLALRSRSFTLLEEEDRARRSATVYFGRGWIQLTGLRRYRAAGAALALDLIERPELVVPHNAEVTAWYWSAHRLHAFSDAGDVLGCARAIDWTATRPRHLALLREIYERARRVLAGAPGLAA